MTKKNSEYWQKRFIALENAQNQYSQKVYNQIAPAFEKAERQIQQQIEVWYQRFADNNGVSMQEARRLLNADELKELKWDVKEYIKYGKENAFSQEWLTELENASARYHISRLEALKLRTQQSLEVAYGNELDQVDAMLRHQFTDGYYHSCFEIMRGFGVGWDIGQIDDKKLSRIISNPWAADGKTFSDRIWQSKAQMVNDLHQQLTRACLLGKAPDQTIRSLSKYVKDKTKNARYQVGRLVMTESAWIGSVSQREAFNDLDVEEFEVVATLDSRTSEICQEMDGQHFSMKEYQIGVTAPPFHVFCRSCTCPYFDDEFTNGERIARDEDGETYFVPENMTYPEWKEAFVDGGSKDKLTPHRDWNERHEVRTVEQIQTSADEINTMLGKLGIRDSEWNGTVTLKEKGSFCEVLPDGSIGIAEDASDISILHELLHTRSFMSYGLDTYIECSAIEEASVEFLTRELAKKENYPLLESTSDILALHKINRYAKINETDYDFALELFNVNLPERMDWLLKKLSSANISEETYDDIIDSMLEGGFFE